MGGVAGIAGLFSNIVDMSRYAEALTNGLLTLIPRELFCETLDPTLDFGGETVTLIVDKDIHRTSDGYECCRCCRMAEIFHRTQPEAAVYADLGACDCSGIDYG